VESLWHFVVRDKYLKNSSLIDWLRKPEHKVGSVSRIWASLLRTLPIILNWITWIPGSGTLIKIGCDIILGLGLRSILSNDLRLFLNSNQITLLAHASKTQNHSFCTDRWKSSENLGLADPLASEWTNFTKALNGEGITLAATNKDVLIWAGGDRSGAFTCQKLL
jgi:hypothetical protein